MILYIVQKEAVLPLTLWNSTLSFTFHPSSINLLLNLFINVKIIIHWQSSLQEI